MKKEYFSPESEVIKIEPVVLSATSPDEETTNPIPVIDGEEGNEAASEGWG